MLDNDVLIWLFEGNPPAVEKRRDVVHGQPEAYRVIKELELQAFRPL